MIRLIVEAVIYCIVFTLLVKVFASDSPLKCMYFYPKEYQEKAYELGLVKREDVERRRHYFHIYFILAMLFLLIFIIRFVNKVTDFWNAYLQSLFILEVMNWFDGIVIDMIWVAKDSFWNIKEIDLPYVQSWPDVLRKRGILTVVWVIGSFITAAMIVLLGK